MSSFKLRQELLRDPLGRGYAGMSDAQVLADITDTSTRSLQNRDSISSSELYEALDRSEYLALTPGQRAEVNILLGLGEIIIITASSKARGTLIALFDGASATRAALLAMVGNLTQSRLQELGIRPDIDTDLIAAARLPDQAAGPPVFNPPDPPDPTAEEPPAP